jgi:NTE family protein
MKVCAVLGGGGAKAAAHAGAWRALVEADLTPSCIAGTSMGAVLGAAFAAGQRYEQVQGHLEKLTGHAVAPLNPLALVTGIFSGGVLLSGPLARVIGQFVPAKTFEDLRLPLAVTAVDVATGRLVVFGAEGLGGAAVTTGIPLHLALQASCALPDYYEPVTIFGRRYADGGLRAVLPLDTARALFSDADLFVAVDVGPGFDEIPSPNAKNAIPALVRAHGTATRILMAELTERAVASWPAGAPRLIVVRAVAESEATFAAGEAARYVQMGYDATRRSLARS